MIFHGHVEIDIPTDKSYIINHFQAGSIYNSSNVILGQILNVACDAAPGTRKEAHEGWLVGKGALFNMTQNTFTFRVKFVSTRPLSHKLECVVPGRSSMTVFQNRLCREDPILSTSEWVST